MNRDELLAASFGPDAKPREGDRVHEILDEETGAVLSHLDVYLRRIMVVPVQRPGQIAEASTTLTVAAIANVCTDADHRGNGYATRLLEAAHAEARGNEWLSFAAVFTRIPQFYERVGYRLVDERNHPRFMVLALHDGYDWPACRFFDTNGEW